MDPLPPQEASGEGHADDAPPPERGGRRVQSIACGRCGWPSSCVVQDGMRLLSFVCHWCGKTTVGVVDPTIKRNVIF